MSPQGKASVDSLFFVYSNTDHRRSLILDVKPRISFEKGIIFATIRLCISFQCSQLQYTFNIVMLHDVNLIYIPSGGSIYVLQCNLSHFEEKDKLQSGEVTWSYCYKL